MKDRYRMVRPFVLTALWLLASPLSSSTAYAQTCVSPPSGLVSWWPLDETSGTTAADYIGTNPGTHVNGPTPVVGNVAGALSFDGVNDFVTFGTSTGNFGTSDFTMDWWMKTSLSVPQSVISKRAVCGAVNFYDVRMKVGKVVFEIRQATPTSIIGNVVSASAVNDGQYHHIAAVRQGVTSRIYVDGVLEATTTASGVININNTAQFTAGRSPCIGIGGTVHYKGEFDEIEIFNKALSTSEIQAIFNAGSAGKCNGPTNQAPDCSGAAPSVAEIWPPNHKFVDVNIVGVTDPDGDPVTITVTKITQDEPRNTFGDGNFEPDGGGLGTSTAQVRAERSGSKKVPGNGRVYEISFTAADGQGGTCDARVRVCVPHDQRPGHVCIDEGQFFNSVTGGAAKLTVPADNLVEKATLPEGYELLQNYPNPFNPTTTLRFSVPEASVVKLAVYDVLGREVRVLADGTREAGTHEVVFEAGDLPSGTYLVRLVTPAGSFVQTMQLMK